MVRDGSPEGWAAHLACMTFIPPQPHPRAIPDRPHATRGRDVPATHPVIGKRPIPPATSLQRIRTAPETIPESEREQSLTEEQRQRRRLSREKYKAADPERARWQRRESQRRGYARLKAERAHRERARERVRAWAAANPERVRQRQRGWSGKNPERVREHKRNYYHRNREIRRAASRDQNARRRQDPAEREKARLYQVEHREHRNLQQNERRSTPGAREKHNREQNERRARERRRRELGLPPRPMHRATINERARNAAAAEEFFTRKRNARELRILGEELAEVHTESALGSEARRRANLAARIRADAERPARIAAAVSRLLETGDGIRLKEAVRMDSIARTLRGKGPYPDLDVEVRRRAAAALAARHAAPVNRRPSVPVGHSVVQLTGRATRGMVL